MKNKDNTLNKAFEAAEHCCCEHEHNAHKHDECCEHDCHAGHDSCHAQDICTCSCGCGHSHEDEENRTLEIVKIALCALFTIGGAVLHFFGLHIVSFALYAAAALVGGYSIFINGAKSLIKLDINESLLMSISVIAAFIIGEAFEGAMVTLLFGIGELLEDMAVDSSRRRIEKLSEIRPDTARLLCDDGKSEVVRAENVKINDTILVAPFERIPLDGCIIEGEGELDTSALTGESMPRTVKAGDNVLSGMMNGSTMLKIRVTGEFSDSAASRILSMVEDASARKGNTEKLISRFAKIYTPIVVLLAILTAAVVPLLGLGEFTDWLHRALVFLVASCPCAIVISVPLCFYAGIGAASKKGILVKGSRFIEAVAQAKTVVFDKTGTLTDGKLIADKVISLGKYSENELLSFAGAAESFSEHPIAAAINELCQEKGEIIPTADCYEEIAGMGVKANVNGKKIECVRASKDDESISELQNASVIIKIDGKAEGGFEISSRLRSDAQQTVAKLKRLGVKKIMMLTGDSSHAAEQTAAQCGIDEYHAELMPQDKLAIMQQAAANGEKTIFVGDGINDAPVLAFADTGVAMGLGTDAAIESADMVLSFDRLSDLPRAVSFFRKVCAKARFNIAFALAVKAAVLVLAVCGIAPMWLAVFADVGVTVLAIANSALLIR